MGGDEAGHLHAQLRVAAWNCYGRVDHKIGRVIDEFAPDVLVVPESEPNPAIAKATLLTAGVPHAWVGDRAVPNKGLGVFAPAADAMSVVRTSDERTPGLWVAADVGGPLDIRVIGMVARVHPGGRQGWPSANVAATAEMFDHLGDLIRDQPTIVAGDFNFSAQSGGPRIRDFFRHIREEFGLRSAYHAFHGVEPGDEADMTLWFRWSRDTGFHCDLVLIPDSYEVADVHVGTFDEWTAPGTSTRAITSRWSSTSSSSNQHIMTIVSGSPRSRGASYATGCSSKRNPSALMTFKMVDHVGLPSADRAL